MDEVTLVRERYARRVNDHHRYTLLNPVNLLIAQERQRALAKLFVTLGWSDLKTRRVLEVGCGSGSNLLELLRFGFAPECLQGIELLPNLACEARRLLPPEVRVEVGDALSVSEAIAPPGSQDVVFQSTVFSSLLDDDFQIRLAKRMWNWVRPGGGILWYDFTFNNPANPDVRGVPLSRIRSLFPGKMQVKRLTLAPPIARTVTRIHPSLYNVFNACVLLRTHVLAWVEKPLSTL